MELFPYLQEKMELFQLKMEELFNLLKNSDLKLIEKETKIPYDRMYKWRKGLGKPKAGDYAILMAYFNNGSNSIGDKKTELNQYEQPNQVPMFNFPGSASAIEMYNDPNDIKIVGHLSIPGSTKNSFALQAYGHSMYPTLENGCWGILRPIEDPTDILWGEIYYIEWGDYRNYKRLLISDSDDEVILWSDNQSEVVNGRPKYSPVKIKKESIRRLCLLTDILKKPNY